MSFRTISHRRLLSEGQFLSDLQNLFRRQHVRYGSAEDVEHLGTDLMLNDAFRESLFQLCTAISHMMGETDMTPEEMLVLVGRALGAPGTSEEDLRIPESSRREFLEGYRRWVEGKHEEQEMEPVKLPLQMEVREASLKDRVKERGELTKEGTELRGRTSEAREETREERRQEARELSGAGRGPKDAGEESDGQVSAGSRTKNAVNIDEMLQRLALTNLELRMSLEEIEERMRRMEPKAEAAPVVAVPEPAAAAVEPVVKPLERRPVERRPVELRPVEPRPVEERPVEQRLVEPRSVEQRTVRAEAPVPVPVLPPVQSTWGAPSAPLQAAASGGRTPSFATGPELLHGSRSVAVEDDEEEEEARRVTRLRRTVAVLAVLLILALGAAGVLAWRFYGAEGMAWWNSRAGVNQTKTQSTTGQSEPQSQGGGDEQGNAAADTNGVSGGTETLKAVRSGSGGQGGDARESAAGVNRARGSASQAGAGVQHVPVRDGRFSNEPAGAGERIPLEVPGTGTSQAGAEPGARSTQGGSAATGGARPVTAGQAAGTAGAGAAGTGIAGVGTAGQQRTGAGAGVSAGTMGAGPVFVPSSVMMGYAVKDPRPAFPQSMSYVGDGTVLVELTISPDGRVVNVRPMSGPSELQAAVVDTMRTWRFRPYVVAGKAAEVVTRINFDFSR